MEGLCIRYERVRRQLQSVNTKAEKQARGARQAEDYWHIPKSEAVTHNLALDLLRHTHEAQTITQVLMASSS